MIQTYSSTIRRKEMDAVLTCMVDEKIGPGEMTQCLVSFSREFFSVDGVVALRSPAIALKYAFKALDLPKESGVILSALAPLWQLQAVEDLGYTPLVVDVALDTGLVTEESLEQGIRQGGRVIILSETMGNLPDISAIQSLGIPVIEDISQSVGAFRELPGKDETETSVIKKAGTYGTFSIVGLEEKDIVTAGGGALLMAPGRREWIILKRFAEEALGTDILPDLNSALAYIQLKEFVKNESRRQELFSAFQKALMTGRHKTFMRTQSGESAVYGFPVVLDSGFKDVKSYASRKGIEVQQAFSNTIVSFLDENLDGCINAKSLFLRTAVFPLYPRLGNSQVTSIIKVLGTLP